MVSGKRIAVDSKRFEILAKRKRGKMETLLLGKIAASGRGTSRRHVLARFKSANEQERKWTRASKRNQMGGRKLNHAFFATQGTFDGLSR